MTTPVYNRFGVSVYHGDCLDVMRTLLDASVSSVITDPPAGIGFMGRDWDGNRGGRSRWVQWLTERMEEARRVLKPGGHALVWALPRTSHWTAWALEDAGFDIRDCVVHLYGSGFPKSRNVSLDIDRMAATEREVVGVYQHPDGIQRAWSDHDPSALGYHRWNGSAREITAPATDSARQWNGWGTALKPSSEHWWLCRKPLTSTVAATVLAHGTGALNIDACRVGMSDADRVVVDSRSGSSSRQIEGWGTRGDYAAGRRFTSDTAGRWPPNTVLTHAALLDPVTGEPIGDACAHGCVEGCSVAELDRQSGVLTSGTNAVRTKVGSFIDHGGLGRPGDVQTTYCDTGGASRFFPCFRWEAKAPATERPMVNGKTWPTVKPVLLMRWLARLVTPPGGVILDCFAGTGTTGQAARAEGFPAILIESDPDAISMIRARLDAKPKTEAATAARAVEDAPQDLFDLLGDAS